MCESAADFHFPRDTGILTGSKNIVHAKKAFQWRRAINYSVLTPFAREKNAFCSEQKCILFTAVLSAICRIRAVETH